MKKFEFGDIPKVIEREVLKLGFKKEEEMREDTYILYHYGDKVLKVSVHPLHVDKESIGEWYGLHFYFFNADGENIDINIKLSYKGSYVDTVADFLFFFKKFC